MRPRRLTLSGFASFRDRTELDFDDVDYFALVGPTGHGKSTLIDAIGFALYGQVPRYDDARVVHQVVSLGAQEARVELEFSVGAEVYRATRVVRLRNGKATQQGRLERLLPDGTTESLAGGIREMRPAVEALLRLPFAHFTKCVALPQGEFQRFLHDKPEQRRDVLVRLLDLDVYETLGQRARALAAEHKATADADERQLGALGDASDAAEAAARSRRDALTSFTAEITAALPRDRELAEQAEAASTDATRAEQRLGALRAVHFPDEVAQLGVAQTEAAQAVEGCQDELTAASAIRLEAEKIVTGHETERLTRLLDAHARRTAEVAALAGEEQRLAALTDGDERAQAAVRSAHDAHDVAETRLHQVRVAHAAHALATELRAGEPCPVCRQDVVKVPRRAKVADLETAESELTAAKRLAKQADDVARRAATERSAAHAEVEQRRRGIEALDETLAGAPDEEAVREALAAAREAQQTATKAAQRERDAQAAERTARAELERVRTQLETMERRFTEQRDPLVDLKPPAKSGDLVASWETLVEWAAARVDDQIEVARQAQAAASAANDARAALASALLERAAAHDIRARRLDELQTEVVRAEANATNALERIVEQRVLAAELAQRIAQTRERQQVAGELGRLLRSDQFVEWLIVEALTTLVERASTLLNALSAGAYSLRVDDDGEFVVVDHASADETRSVRTLSGGETFQASLALALALSDRVSSLAADGGAKLEAVFLDEGFGTLDPESLDVVASTIESLGTSGRMVGIVTHVRELAERVPVRFEVTKRGRSSQVEMVTT